MAFAGRRIAGRYNTLESDNYLIVSGNKAPVYGADAGTYPPYSWTGIIDGNRDDGFSTITLPFTFYFNGTGYTTFYPSSNTYITFGAGSANYSSVGPSNPPYDKIMIAAADNSYQRCSYFTDPTYKFVRFRYEGTNSILGYPGSPDIVYEVTFFNPSTFQGKNVVEILVGNQARLSSISGIYSSTALLSGGTIESNTGVSANTSHVLVGDSTGTTWVVWSGYHLSDTGY